MGHKMYPEFDITFHVVPKLRSTSHYLVNNLLKENTTYLHILTIKRK
jgi:hypothetical protein